MAPGGVAPPPAPLRRRPVAVGAPPRRAGAARTVRLERVQLLINQRISQAAVRRANGLEARLRAGLSGGDLRSGAVDAARLAGGLTIAAAAGPAAAPTVTPIARGRTGDARDVRLTRSQLATNQRIAQAGVRRANALAARLAEGLTGADFRPGTITAVNLDPALRGGPGG